MTTAEQETHDVGKSDRIHLLALENAKLREERNSLHTLVVEATDLLRKATGLMGGHPHSSWVAVDRIRDAADKLIGATP